MSVNLVKGQKINLVKPGSAGLKKIMVGLGWDEVQRRRGLFAPKPRDIDCDASVILCGADGKVISNDVNRCCVFFGNLRHASGAIVHQGDNLTGAGEGDDEQIMVDLSLLPREIDKLVFVVNIYDANVRGQHFGMIRNAFIRLVDLKDNSELCRFDLTGDYSGMTGMIVGEIYRRNGEWKFNAIGQGVAQASRLASLINMYR
ncbi:MAG: TerD family protein [Clostridia bacterium]|nr:TerD family protein [Clostridia bacterium]